MYFEKLIKDAYKGFYHTVAYNTGIIKLNISILYILIKLYIMQLYENHTNLISYKIIKVHNRGMSKYIMGHALAIE